MRNEKFQLLGLSPTLLESSEGLLQEVVLLRVMVVLCTNSSIPGNGGSRPRGSSRRCEGKGGGQGGVAAGLVRHEEELLLEADVGVQAPDLVAELLEEPLALAAERLGEVGGDRGEVSPFGEPRPRAAERLLGPVRARCGGGDGRDQARSGEATGLLSPVERRLLVEGFAWGPTAPTPHA